MGLRVHVLKKRIVEYGSVEAFNYAYEKFSNLLDLLSVPNWQLDNEDGSQWECEVDAALLKKAVLLLNRIYRKKANSTRMFDYEEVLDYVENELKTPMDRCIETMKRYIKEGDCHNGYYYFTIL